MHKASFALYTGPKHGVTGQVLSRAQACARLAHFVLGAERGKLVRLQDAGYSCWLGPLAVPKVGPALPPLLSSLTLCSAVLCGAIGLSSLEQHFEV